MRYLKTYENSNKDWTIKELYDRQEEINKTEKKISDAIWEYAVMKEIIYEDWQIEGYEFYYYSGNRNGISITVRDMNDEKRFEDISNGEDFAKFFNNMELYKETEKYNI